MNKNVTYYPLTHPQLGIWYTEKLYPGTSIGNIAGTLKLKEKIDISLLEESINLLLKNHDSFRLHFREIDGKPVQYVTEYKYQKIDFIDFSNQDIKNLYKWDNDQTQIPFSLIDSDLCYFAIIKVSEYEFGIYSKFHHLICDGWSIVLTGNIIMDFYNQLKNGIYDDVYKTSSYIDYVNAENNYLNSSRFADDQMFWDSRVNNLNNSNAPFRKRSSNISTEAKRKTFIVPHKLALKIHEYAQLNKTTVPALFLSALAIYLYRVTGNNEHVVGIPFLNRLNAKEKQTCGMFINTVPLDISIDENIPFCSLVTQITQEWLALLRHQRYPFEYIRKGVEQANSSAGSIYNIMLSYQNAKFIKDDGILAHEGRWHFNGRQVYPLYIHINDREDNDNIIVDYDFLTDMFYIKEIDFIHDHLLRLLWHGLDNPSKPISRLEIVSEKEKQKILHDFNNTQADYPTDITISELFEEQVRAHPDNLAVVDGNRGITYRDLYKKADRLAKVLRSKGVSANTVVGIIIDRSIEMIIAIMGILKAGGLYLPLDPDYPKSRLAYYITDSKPLIVLISDEQYDKNRELIESTDLNDNQLLLLDSIIKDERIVTEEQLSNINSPTDVAYIIYTSGSTGNPKGVLVEHRNVVRLLYNSKNKFDFTSDDVWTMFHSYCFDFSVWEIFGALLYGGKLVIVPKVTAQDPEEFLKILIKHKVTVLNQIPTAFYHLSNAEARKKEHKLSVRYIIFGGEALKPAKLKEWKAIYPDVKMINMYGITETTVHSTYKEVNTELIRSNNCNIGVPIPTTTIYIFDKYKQLVPIGVKGEIYVGGDGVARGYLNRPELTNERFTYNPYKPGEKIYKSGDAGRWYANGEIEYLGRLDYQIKIHGFRVELGEIENKISEFPGIIDIAVLVSEDEVGDNILIAYFVANQEISIQELRKFLGISLPQYMIPAEYVQLDSMPLTSSGKVNRKELKKIERKKTTYNEYCAPRNDSETRMAEILQDVLDIERIGIKDNFFELGIDSLKIIQVQVKAVSFDWGIRTQDFYRYPTIELLYDNIIKQQDRVNYLLNNDYNYKISDILKEEGSKAFRNVLLTGATGFLGIHMLNALLLFTDAKILCLIRKDSIDEDLKYYFKNIDENLLKRITIIKGDITKDCLGLDNQKYEFLIENVDTIIHSAANVRHYGSIDDFNKTNVEGTRQMLALCKKCNAVFHHISTISISGTNLIASSADPKVFAENDFYIGQNIFENVYLYTKFEAERLVLDEAKQGMKVNIYRLGNITGRYSDGVFQRNIYENAFYRRIKSLLMIGSISDQMANIEIDMTPVDICSKAIIDIIKRGNVNCVYHLYSKKFKVRNLVEVINNLVPDSVKIVENNEFIRVIRALSEDKEKQYSLEGLINELNITSGFDYNEDIITSNAKTFEMLETLDIYWPDTHDSLYIEKMTRHMKDVGFLESGIL